MPLLLGLVCILVFNANFRLIGSSDTYPARYLPLILWHDHTLNFETNALLVANGHPISQYRNLPAGTAGKVTYYEPLAYWIIRNYQHQLASFYPIVTPLLVSPLYAPALTWLNTVGWVQPNIDHAAILMEKISASLLAAIACVLMYLVLRRDGSRWSLLMALAFAFGTNTWVVSSQALWQHAAGELLIALALLLILSPPSPSQAALLGAVSVFMAANRPPDALIGAAMLLYSVVSHRRSLAWLILGASGPMAALLAYNIGYFGHITGGYSIVKPLESFYQPMLSGIAGLLVSPTRGLLVFTPFLLFLPIGVIQRLKTPATKWLALTLSLAVTAQFFLYSQVDWRAGVSWGPRWLTNMLPILIWLLAPAALVLRPLARKLLILSVLAAIAIQASGAFWYTGTSDDRIYSEGLGSMRPAWDIKNIPFLVELQHPPAAGELLFSPRGSLDLAGSTHVRTLEEVPDLQNGDALEGWALSGDRTPAQLIVLINGIVIGNTTEFLPRADVNAALQTTAPSGWHVNANIIGVPAGLQVLQLAIRMEPRSSFRIIREQTVNIIPVVAPILAADMLTQAAASDAELADMAEHASALLREHQSAKGYWLTTFTNQLSYQNPQPEMNTFLTAVMVDMLTPLSQKHGLEDLLATARRHLSAQIESNGLVRYHGLPGGPTIGTLGCVITPDSDDTALAWRIANPGRDDPRLPTMLATLEKFRDPHGLYRTWLAPKSQYQCIDPGLDPDPSDLTIQMHIYLMLREFNSPAAQNLCSAIQRSIGQENTWIYYSKTALLTYLRAAELSQLGCEIPLPIERLALPAAGQEIWSELARLLVQTQSVPPTTENLQNLRILLTFLGSDDFSNLRQAPPFLYHNDLSASVRRYYWSEDYGYALWLRLYQLTTPIPGQPQPTP